MLVGAVVEALVVENTPSGRAPSSELLSSAAPCTAANRACRSANDLLLEADGKPADAGGRALGVLSAAAPLVSFSSPLMTLPPEALATIFLFVGAAMAFPLSGRERAHHISGARLRTREAAHIGCSHLRRRASRVTRPTHFLPTLPVAEPLARKASWSATKRPTGG